MEPQVAAGGGRWRCDDEDDVELLGLPRPSSVRRPRPMAKSGHTTLEPFRSLLAFAASAAVADSSAVWTSIGQ